MSIAPVDAGKIPLDQAEHSPAEPGQSIAGRLGGLLPPAFAVIFGTTLIALHARLYERWIVDDAGITFAYARSIAEGHGPVQQPGADPVEGYSNPLWLAIMVVGRWLGLFDHGSWFGVPDYVAFPKAVALLCCAGTLIAIHWAAAAVTGRAIWVTLVAGVLLAVNSSYVIWSFSGLENPLYGLVAAVLAAVLIRGAAKGNLAGIRPAVLTGLLVFALALTRPDGMAYAAAYPLALTIGLRRAELAAAVRMALVHLLAFAVPFALFIGWRYAVFGELVPNTAIAKAQHLPSLEDLGKVGAPMSFAGWLGVLLLTALTGVMWARFTGAARRGLEVALIPLAIALLGYGVLLWDWMPWYRFATPVWVLGSLVAGLVLVEAAVSLHTRQRLVIGMVALLAFGISVSSFKATAEKHRTRATVPLCAVADQFGRLINGYGDRLGIAQGSLAAADIGGVLLTSRYAVYDLAGLTDRRIAEAYKRDEPGLIGDYIFDEVKPTFVLLHKTWARKTGLLGDRRMADAYVPLDQDLLYVRRDAVRDQAALKALQATVPAETDRRWAKVFVKNSMRSCGPTLHPPGRK